MNRIVTRIARNTSATLAAALGLACGPLPAPGGPYAGDDSTGIPGMLDSGGLLRRMGLLTAGPPTPFVAAVRYLAGPSPDTTVALVGISLANTALVFRRAGETFEAGYRVDGSFTRNHTLVAQFSASQVVRVASFEETQRTDESVIFQRFLELPPGGVVATLTLRDRFGAAFSRVEDTLRVPSLAGEALAAPIPVYQATPRTRLDTLPSLVVNPRAAVAYGGDSLRLYVESYRPDLTSLAVRVSGGDDRPDALWADTVSLHPKGELATAIVSVPGNRLPLGTVTVRIIAPVTHDTVWTSAMVSFSDEWAVANLDEMLSLLRYFGHDQRLRDIRDAPPDERAELWRALWRETDPNPRTTANEALDAYFGRLREANKRFREPGKPGWLTERGEVYITLGEPDDVVESRNDLPSRGLQVIRWQYADRRLALDFVDEAGFGEFRLTPGSRRDFERERRRVEERR